MGERTQLFINVEDANGEQILGTIIHYQWGIGRVMLESALHIATNMEVTDICGFGKSEEQKSHEAKIFEILKNYCGFKKPALTYALRKSIVKNIGTGGKEVVSLNAFEEALKKPVRDIQKDECFVFGIQDPEEDVKEAYAAKYSDFFYQCDNNDGLMFMDVQLKNSVDKTASYYMGHGEIKFGFGLTTDIYKRNPDWHPATFEQYARQKVNSDFLSEDFKKGYKLILKGYGIEMMSTDELKSKRNRH